MAKAGSKTEDVEILEIDGRPIRVTHPGKPYFSQQVKPTERLVVGYVAWETFSHLDNRIKIPENE